MIELLIFAAFYALLALTLVIRLVRGPHAIDRVVVSDGIELLLACALTLFSCYSGRGIYLDIALTVALLGFISTVLISRYVGGRL